MLEVKPTGRRGRTATGSRAVLYNGPGAAKPQGAPKQPMHSFPSSEKTKHEH